MARWVLMVPPIKLSLLQQRLSPKRHAYSTRLQFVSLMYHLLFALLPNNCDDLLFLGGVSMLYDPEKMAASLLDTVFSIPFMDEVPSFTNGVNPLCILTQLAPA